MNPTAKKIDPKTECASRNAFRKETWGAVPGVPIDLSHSVDQNGSLVTVPPAEWLICFVPGLQKQSVAPLRKRQTQACVRHASDRYGKLDSR